MIDDPLILKVQNFGFISPPEVIDFCCQCNGEIYKGEEFEVSEDGFICMDCLGGFYYGKKGC